MSKLQLHAYVLIMLFGLAIAGARLPKSAVAGGPPKTKFEKVPMELAGWYGSDGEFPPGTQAALPTCSLLLRHYVHEDGYGPIELAVVYGTDLGDFHQPEFCLEGQGMQRLSAGDVRIRNADGTSFTAVALIMEREGGRRAFVYWFASKRATSTFLGSYKTKIFFYRLLRRKVEPSAMVRLSTEVMGSDEEAGKEAIGQLVGFAETIVPFLRKEFTTGAL